jgi:tetraacyldisaccharide 4'-kinase
MPTGRLREHPTGAKRADAVIVSKCPPGLTAEEMDQIRGKVRFYAQEKTPVFFSTYRYGEPIPFGGAAFCQQKVILVTGIANPAPINDYLRQAGFTVVEHLAFRDHYPYTAEDLEKIKKLIAASHGEPLSVITTRKDAVRLLEPAYKPLREALPLFYLPIEVSFLRDQENFDKLVLSRVKTISEGSFL